MHMANELLSVPVAGGTLAIAAGVIAIICRKAKQVIDSQNLALMGVMGAFVFAAQMVNFQLPAMPGTSGHMVGAVLLAIILGPHLGTIAISSVVIVQCLIFQDGGLLALGCNIINMGIVPCYLGSYVYRSFAGENATRSRIYVGAIIASVMAMLAGAVLVPIEAAASGVLVVPFHTFLVTMLGVHFLVGIVEGVVTAAVVAYLWQVRPDIFKSSVTNSAMVSRKKVYATMVIATVLIAGGLSLLASGMPDGLEWSYLERPDESGFESMVANESETITAVDEFHEKYSLFPDYSIATSQEQTAAGWTSFAGVVGAGLTMATIFIVSILLKKKKTTEH